MSYNSTIFNQLLQQVNYYDFQNQVSKYNGDKGVSKFFCKSLLKIMMFAQLRTKETLRDTEVSLYSKQSQFYHLGIDSAKRSSLSDALKTRPHQVFEDYYYNLLNELNNKCKRKLRRKLKIIDSTTISLCLSKCNWAEFRKTKGGIKLHVLLDNQNKAPEEVIITKAKKHDSKVATQFKIKEGEMYVFDRGYNDYKYWNILNLGRCFFVTRLKKNALYEVIKSKELNKKYGVLKDEVIKLTGIKKDEYKNELRLITYYDKQTNKLFKFVTNNFKLSTNVIAEIYKERWQIELFFKWIKTNLKIKKFLSTSENGIRIQIWTALITYLLIMLVQQQLNVDMQLITILRIIKENLDKRIELSFILTNKYKIKTYKNQQLELKLW